MAGDDRPPVQDLLQEIGANTLGDDPPPAAREAVLRRWIKSLDGIGPGEGIDSLRIRMERDALAALPGLTAGAVDDALKAREEAHRRERDRDPPEDPEPDPEQIEHWHEEGRPILEARDQLKLFRDKLDEVGYVGDTVPAELVHVALHSRGLDRPLNVVMTGPSAAGKTYSTTVARQFHPEDALYSLDGMSERALVYSSFPTAHRYVLISESSAMYQEGIGASIIRSLAWGEGLRYGTVVSTGDGPQYVEIERPGPTGLITTTTKPLQEEIATRMIHVPIADTPEQTREILGELARQARGEHLADVDLSDSVAASRFLTAVGENRVVVPYAEELARQVPASDVRMRRDFEQVLTLIRTLAYMHQLRRERDEEGRVVAGPWDYRNARRLASRVLQVTLSAVTDGVREAVEVVRRLTESDDLDDLKHRKGVSYPKLGDELGMTRQGAHYRARAALKNGWLVNKEERKGRPARLVVGDPLPDDEPVLPPADTLFDTPFPEPPLQDPFGFTRPGKGPALQGESTVKGT